MGFLQGYLDKDFDNMSMFEQEQYINEYVLKELGVDSRYNKCILLRVSIDVDSTAFENPQVKESE